MIRSHVLPKKKKKTRSLSAADKDRIKLTDHIETLAKRNNNKRSGRNNFPSPAIYL